MNKNVTFVTRAIAGGIIGMAAGRAISHYFDVNRQIATSEALIERLKKNRSVIDALLENYEDLLSDVPAASKAVSLEDDDEAKTLTDRIAKYTEEELVWILDQLDAMDAECGDEQSEPSWALPGSPIRSRIDATNEHIRSAWGSTDGCTIDGCSICEANKKEEIGAERLKVATDERTGRAASTNGMSILSLDEV